VPNGIAVRDSDATREQARAAFGVPTDAFAVGCVARLVKQKRLDRLIEAVASLDTVHAVIAGDGYMRRPLEQLATALGCDGRVHFAGHVEDVARVHRALDAYVVASDQEGMSSGMLEAMAAGLPVVST